MSSDLTSTEEIAGSGGTTNPTSGLDNTPLEYVLSEIMPGVVATVDLICILVGIPMNVMLCVALFKRQRHREMSHAIILHVAIMDIVALVVIVSPSFITACTKAYWVFGPGLCVFHGILVTSFFVMTFSYCVWSIVERVLKVSKPKVWTRVFTGCNRKLFPLVIAIQWILAVGYCVLPLAGVSAIQYQVYGLQCDREYSDNKALAHVHFTVCYMLPFLVFSACAIMIAYKRLMQRPSTDIEVTSSYGNLDEEAGTSGHRQIEVRSQDQSDSNDETERIENDQTKVKSGYLGAGNKRSMNHVQSPRDPTSERNKQKQRERSSANSGNRSARRRTTNSRSGFFNWDIWESVDDFQLASTLTLSWGTTFGLWCFYVLTAYLIIYQNPAFPLWRGIYPLAVMVANLSYGFKPFIYIFHNAAIRLDFKHIIPGKAQKKYKEAQKKYKQYSTRAKETVKSIETKAKEKFSSNNQTTESVVANGNHHQHSKTIQDDVELTPVKTPVK